MYRKPHFCIQQFMGIISDSFGKICDKTLLFVCGDFNVDLLKWKEYKLTTEIFYAMFSFGLWPPIDKPSMITKDSATLIDNIYQYS